MDLKTERQVQRCLNEISKNVTTIVIVHRLSMIRHADDIIVLDKGEIAEEGTHDQLLEKNGLYCKLLAKDGKEK